MLSFAKEFMAFHQRQFEKFSGFNGPRSTGLPRKNLKHLNFKAPFLSKGPQPSDYWSTHFTNIEEVRKGAVTVLGLLNETKVCWDSGQYVSGWEVGDRVRLHRMITEMVEQLVYGPTKSILICQQQLVAETAGDILNSLLLRYRMIQIKVQYIVGR